MPDASGDSAASGSLPNGLCPFEDESLSGFIVRLTANHFHDRPLEFLTDLSGKAPTLIAAVAQKARQGSLANYLRLSVKELERFWCAEDENPRVLGHDLHRDLIKVSSRKYCPICIAEVPYHRAFWDLTVVTVCPVHGVPLVDQCPHCDQTLGWNTDSVSSCSHLDCFGDLRDAMAIPVSESEMDGVRGLHMLLQSGACETLGAPVRALSISDQILLIYHLGSLTLGHAAMMQPLNLIKLHPGTMHLIINAGWRVCTNWPAGLHAFLDLRRAKPLNHKRRYGVQKHFGLLHGWLERNGEPYAQVIAGELHNYIVARPDFLTRATSIRRARKAVALKHRYVTSADAREILGVGVATMHRLAIERDLYLVAPSGSGAPALLRAEPIQALLQERSQLLAKTDVCRLLGTGKATVHKLLKAGFLSSVPETATVDGVMFSIKSVDALLQELDDRVSAAEATADERITMATIARRVPRPGFDVCDVLEAVRAGRIAPVAISPMAKGFRRYLFSSAEVDRFIAEITYIPGRTMSVVEAAQELGVKQEVAYHWARTGLLESIAVGSEWERGKRLTAEALDAFKREFVTAAEFARLHNVSWKFAAKNLISMGVKAVSGPSVDQARQFLFRRADVERMEPDRQASKRSKLQPRIAHPPGCDFPGRGSLEIEIGCALREEFGIGLTRHHKTYNDPAVGLVIQSVVANNYGIVGEYKLLVTAKHSQQLGDASRAFVAIGFMDQDEFLLVPWAEFEQVITPARNNTPLRTSVLTIHIGASLEGVFVPFNKHARRLRPKRT